jgi:hypothetical protein
MVQNPSTSQQHVLVLHITLYHSDYLILDAVLRCSLIQTKFDYPQEDLQKLVHAALDLVLIAKDDVEAQVGHLSV